MYAKNGIWSYMNNRVQLFDVMAKYLLALLLCSFCSYAFVLEKLDGSIPKILSASREQHHLPAISLSIQLPGDNEIYDYVMDALTRLRAGQQTTIIGTL